MSPLARARALPLDRFLLCPYIESQNRNQRSRMFPTCGSYLYPTFVFCGECGVAFRALCSRVYVNVASQTNWGGATNDGRNRGGVFRIRAQSNVFVGIFC